MGYSLEDYIYSLSKYALIKEKIEALWVGDDPVVAAYWGLKGTPVIRGIINTENIQIRNNLLNCAHTVEVLNDIREQYPKVTKEQVLEMLNSASYGQ